MMTASGGALPLSVQLACPSEGNDFISVAPKLAGRLNEWLSQGHFDISPWSKG